MKVSVRHGNVDKALSILRKKCKPILDEVQNRQTYEKPTTSRKAARRRAIMRERKRVK